MRALILIAYLLSTSAFANDDGQWGNSDPAVREWYKNLMQPDAPTSSCCGEADAYWCDTIHSVKGKTTCTITDDRDDVPLGRPHVEVGTVIEIPDNKLKWDRGNPTGHAIVFLGRGGWYSSNHISGYVFCFVQNGGT